VLDDRAGAHEEVDVACVVGEAGELRRDPAAREAAREDLRAGRREPGVEPVQERRVRRHRQDLGKHTPQPVADVDRAVRAADADVDVEAEGVVAARDVAQVAEQALVVVRVDDLLLPPRAPGVRPGGHQQGAAVGREPEQPRARLALARQGVREGLAPVRADLDLRRDQLSSHASREDLVALRGRAQLLEALHERARLGVEDAELLLDPDREVRRGLEDLPGSLHVEHVTT
jgi:hypothetical protein